MKNFASRLSLLFLVLASSTFAGTANSDGEVIEDWEMAANAEVSQIISKMVTDAFHKQGKAFRDAHRKAHGCAVGELQVLNNQGDLRQGLFAKAENYSAMIRFSNGSGESSDDHNGDGRGIAVKVFDVPGKSLDADPTGRETQDFLGINNSVFFVKNAKDYLSFQRAIGNGKVMLWFLNPLRIFHEFAIANKIRNKKVRNPLATPYWSMTPYKMGKRQMKYQFLPCADSKIVDVDDSKDLLGKNLARSLEQGQACFSLRVQLRSDNSMPIEDATVDWSEKKSPFVEVARLKIPQQKVTLDETCEKTAFNPWHSLPEHRPLGSISRTRRVVYKAISTLRNDLNK